MKIEGLWAADPASGAELAVERRVAVGLSHVGKGLGRSPGPGAQRSGAGRSQGFQPLDDLPRLHRGNNPTIVATANHLSAASRGRCQNRQTRGQRLEVNIAEGLVARRQRHGIGGGVEPFDALYRPGPKHTPRQAQLIRESAIRPGISFARDNEPALAIGEPAHGFDQRAQPFALEARAHEQDRPGFVGYPPFIPHDLAEPLPVVRVESLQVHAVVDHADPAGRRGIQPLDLGFSMVRDRDDVPGGLEGEHPLFQREYESMIRIYLSPPALHRLEVSPMAAFARAVDVLAERPLMALDDLIALAQSHERTLRQDIYRAGE